MILTDKSVGLGRIHRFTVVAGLLLLLLMRIDTANGQGSYQPDIDRWKAQDLLDAPPAGAILFIGSSSIRRWEDLTRDFADYKVVQRGFGGSTFLQLNSFIGDIVLPYNPRAIVIWSGTNDINNGDTGAQIFDRYQTFVNTVLAAQPAVDIFFIGITRNPGTNGDVPKTTQRLSANSLISGYISSAGNPRLHYIDMPAAFESLSTVELNAYYVDTLHLNRMGYDTVWSPLIRASVEAVVPPNKVVEVNAFTPVAGKKILFDFGPGDGTNGDKTTGTDALGNRWNNWHTANGGATINAGEHLANLVDISGATTGIRLTITGGFSSNGKLNGGLLSPNVALLGNLGIATATEDYFYSTADGLPNGGSDDVPGGFMLSGLNPSLLYDFRFLGSRTAVNTTDSRSTIYAVSGANSGSATLETSGNNIGSNGAYDGNDDETAVVRGIKPNKYGDIFIDLTAVQVTNTFAYINAMEVTVVSAFEGWTRSRGLASGAGFGDIPGSGGITNLKHFAWDTNPLGGGGNEGKQRGMVLSDAGQDYLTFTFPVRRGAVFSGSPLTSTTVDGVVYRVLGDDNLQGTDLVVIPRTLVDTSQMPSLGDYDGDGIADYEYQSFRLAQPILSQARGFVWIEVAAP